MVQGLEEADYLPLSGIQHYAHCPRQWALIHVEGQWAENVFTAQGRALHERVDSSSAEARSNLVTCRAVPLASSLLGLSGRADVVEFRQYSGDTGVRLTNREGVWQPFPVEFKRGRPKTDDRDEVQLCAQAMCLEEMLALTISEGAIYYGRTRRRHHVAFDGSLRGRVMVMVKEMHEFRRIGVTPPPRPRMKGCGRCSLVDLCMPKLPRRKSVDSYIRRELLAQEGV